MQTPLLAPLSRAFEHALQGVGGGPLGDNLRSYLDSLDATDLKASLRLLRDECARSGWDVTARAAELAFGATGRMDGASISVAAARIASGANVVEYDDPIDLGVYDMAFTERR